MDFHDTTTRISRSSFLPIGLALVAIGISLLAFFGRRADTAPPRSHTPPGLLDRIEKECKIQAGYGVYPPYTAEDPNSHKVSGFSVDVLTEVAHQLGCTVTWHRFNWNTMSADLKRGEFDVIADPIFQTIPRAREFSFTQPYAYFADGIAVVRKEDSRFTTFDSLDRIGVTIAVGQGWASETLLRSRFSKANINSVQTASDLLQVFNEVASGRADVAVADEADAKRFVDEHSSVVKALWLDSPPAFMPAGFALRLDDRLGTEFLSVSLRNLQSTGVLDAIAARYSLNIRKPPQP